MSGIAQNADVIVIGAGIAGISAAAELAEDHSVLLLEQESHPGTHSTGRSAALLIPGYGGPVNTILTGASIAFFHNPPHDWDSPLLTRRGMLWLASSEYGAGEHGAALSPERLGASPAASAVAGASIAGLCPLLADPGVWAALFDPDVWDIDVHALQSGYLRKLRRLGGRIRVESRVTGLCREAGLWRVSTPSATYQAPIVVNAAGAWADGVAELAGLSPLGLDPRRRTAITFDVPAGRDIAAMPCVCDAGESFYFKPESGCVLGSAADATPSAPTDAQPEEIDVAVAIDRLEKAMGITIRHIRSKWAGLRTFTPDGTPVMGEDPRTPGFMWLAGQGGAGIMTSPALARRLAQYVLGSRLSAQGLVPERFLS